MKGLTIQCDVHFTRGQRTRKVIQEGPLPVPGADVTPEGTVPRISRLMALAIRFNRLIKAGDFPPPVRLGGNSIAWVESEIEDWAAKKAASREQFAN